MKKFKKPLLFALTIVAILAILGQFVRLPILGVHPHAAIPRHTAVVLPLGVKDFQQLQSDEGKKSLANIAVPSDLLTDLAVFDLNFRKLFIQKKQAESIIALQPTRSSGMDALFIFDGMRGNDLKAILGENPAWRMRKSIFKDNDVYTVHLEKETFAMARFRNLLLFARHAYLVENALSQLENPANTLCRDSGFSGVAKAGDATEKSLPVLLNLSELGPQFSPMLDPSRLHDLEGLANTAHWLRLDLPLNKKNTDWSGSFSLAEGHPIMDANAKGKSQPFKQVLSALPDNLTAFAWLSCDRIVTAAETGLWRTYFASWASNEVALAVGEPLENSATEQFLLLKTKDSNGAEAKLAALAKRLESPENIDFQMFKIRRFKGLPLDKMLSLGSSMHDPYATVLGEYVLFSNSKTGLERWLGKYLAGQTCSKNVDFLQVLRNLPKTANGLLFFESDRAWPLASQFFEEGLLGKIGRNPLNFSQLAATFSRKGKVCELQFATPMRASTEQAAPANILWKTPLGNRATTPPTVFVNPETGEPEIFVQDASHTIYLISKAGRILWRRQLGEPIRSKIWQLDLNNDKEEQFAFSTDSGIFAIDQTGQNVAGFPLRLQTPASNGVTVVDFFKSHEYEFFITCENGSAYGFNEKGSPVEGWRPKTGIGTVRHPLVHFQAKGKDFLMLLDTAGVLQVFQKNGEYRFPKKDLASNFLQSPDFQSDGENYRIVVCDDHGRVSVANLEGGDFKLALDVGKKQAVKFAFADVVGDQRKDYLAFSGGDLAVYFYEGKNFKKAFKYQFSQPQDAVFPVAWAKRKAFTGTVCEAKSQISLLDGQGKLLPQFPLAGTTAFSIVDLLGDGKPMVVVGNGASMVAYSLE
ncbi:MAG: hypothetical protein K9J37_06840 [Saprospiraceae bacterium]|nr:hypothetical protein [Saprospiraceae bacterium]MCF8249611.1 hypothetical protein [Saprospiraceae bacterium]MCF8310443.1 hypothetical protein [Saprospiraceae bacterium]MCF8439821.1 hypothetical protein [Saprospiraceae bacterium]